MRYDIVFWDFNGTLIDDFRAALDCVNEMLLEEGGAPIDIERYYALVDTPIINFYTGLYGSEDIDFIRIARDFHDRYDKKVGTIPLMPYAEELLRKNQAAGMTQIIITSSHREEVRGLVEHYGVADCFDDILGASDQYAAGKLNRAVDYFTKKGFDRSGALFVGDTLHDRDVADALGVDCVLLSSGHQGGDILRKAGCRVVDSLIELEKIIFQPIPLRKGN